MKLIMAALGILTLLAFSSAGAAQTIEKKGLTLDGARKVLPPPSPRQEARMRRAEPLP